MTMLRASIAPARNAFTRRLAQKAGAIAAAHAESRWRAARKDPLSWRLARLLWPQFNKDF